MRKFLLFFTLLNLVFVNQAPAQATKKIDDTFFLEEQPLEITIQSDFKTLLAKKLKKEYQPAVVTFRFPDSSSIKEEIRIQTRGKFRLETCFMPPLMLNFKNPGSPLLKPLGKLKLVCGCGTSSNDEQLIIKEFMAYKIYNMLTERSFKVRLVKINYDDSRGKIKKYSQYGFLLEDVDDMAARNNCVEVEGTQYLTEKTDREQMTLVALFEYMIGNTDFSVPHYHNVKLMRPVKDSTALPIVVPYDLNHCGFVNADYALPNEELNIKSVRERLYRGFPRTMEELEPVIAIFKNTKQKIWSLINNCPWMNAKNKKETISYLEEFYEIIESKSSIRYQFIDNARTQ
jgi:hypothetical protein